MPSGERADWAYVDFLSPAGRGWEYIAEAPLLDAVPGLIDMSRQLRKRTPVDIGRFDVVLSAQSMAALVEQTIGAATELDRAMGLEANTTGTSYLSSPLDMLGAFRIGPELLNITANRSVTGGLATVQWDDEAVEPDDFSIVSDGVLVDFQTNREQARWLAPYYQRIGQPVKSRGCAKAEVALSVPIQWTPNLALEPGRETIGFDDLVADTPKGIAIIDLGISMDQQLLSGIAWGTMREIRNGQLGRFIDGAGFVFRTADLWKNLVAIGGPASQRWFGRHGLKGRPLQIASHSVAAVPAKLTGVSIMDYRRGA